MEKFCPADIHSNRIQSLGFILFLLVSGVMTTSVQMRVVRDTASYGYFGPYAGENENNQPLSNVSPSNFSGPRLLHRLMGKCYNLTQDQYRYTFCPFQNFSQYELSSRWNAYRGILGIWSHWNITDNSFNSMVYSHGDQCGDIERSVQVHLKCGMAEILTNVSEPSKCFYSATFESRYVCDNDSLLVYPRLKLKLQKQWDQLFTDFHNDEITQKGYYRGLDKVLYLAGLLENKVSELPKTMITEASTQLESLFTDLATCNKEYKNIAKEISHLNKEIDALKLLFDLNKIENRTTKLGY